MMSRMAALWFSALVLVALVLAAGLPVRAQTPFPTHPVRFVVPFPGGGINDVLARILADKLQPKWGQPVVIENRTGAGGNIGADYAAAAEPDGHTLMVTAPGPVAINQSLYRQLSYRPEDFVPLTIIADVANLIIVRPDLGVSSVAELIDLARKNPGKLTFGSQGNGSTPHLTGNMFQNLTGTSLVHVPYRGENLVINDLLGGHVDVFFGNIAPALPHYRAGKVKVLAITDVKRATSMPEVPTVAEAGLPGFISTAWFAVVGPPKLPPGLARTIAADLLEVLQMPDVRDKIRLTGTEPVGMTPEQSVAFIARETTRWRDVITANNIRIE